MPAAPLEIGVLALQGDFREHELALRAVGASTRRVRSANELVRLDGLVIPGGESTTIGKLAEKFELIDPIAKLVDAGLPIYGSCAGMIMLAEQVRDALPGQPTIGGIDMAVRRNAFGRQVASFESELAIEAIGEPAFPGVFIRAPWVESVGPQVVVLAAIESEDGAGRIVAVRQGALLATAFHPELTGDNRIHGYFVDIVRGNA